MDLSNKFKDIRPLDGEREMYYPHHEKDYPWMYELPLKVLKEKQSHE